MGGGVDNIPDGWNLCDGTNGTPDLRDKFILGAGSTYSIGDTGGESEVTLTISQTPKHTHTISYDNETRYIEVTQLTGNGTGVIYGTGLMVDATNESYHNLSYSGNNEAHDNMPPYYALAYIMKL